MKELFSSCMKDHASGACYETLVSVFAPMVNQSIATVVALVADLH